MNENPANPRRAWFAMLAPLVYPTDPARAADAFKPMIAMFDSFPPEAFTRASLEAVALRPPPPVPKGATPPLRGPIPDFAEIHAALSAWWRENRPTPRALAPPDSTPQPREPPSQAEVDAVAAILASWRMEKAQAAVERAEREGKKAHVVKPAPLKPDHLADMRAKAGIRSLPTPTPAAKTDPPDPTKQTAGEKVGSAVEADMPVSRPAEGVQATKAPFWGE